MPANQMSYPEQRQRLEDEFRSAAVRLQNALPATTCARLCEISFPEFRASSPVEATAKDLETALEGFFQTRSERARNGGKQKKVEGFAVKWFRASYPFATLFLAVAAKGCQVCL